MNKLHEVRVMEIMNEEYRARLLEALAEADVVDKEGNIIISKDLKVRHKKSGYEYTVDRVEGQGDNIHIYLRDPSDPRIDPPGEEAILGGLPDAAEMLDEDDLVSPVAPVAEEELENLEDDDIFVVDKTEFEMEYVVE